jgi:uncharacterized protein YjbI with pentapeptide repeats
VLRDVSFERGSLANVRVLKGDWRRVRVAGTRGTGLELGEAHLIDVTFEDAKLDYASFRNGRLERVIFRNCRLDEADFGGAQLTSVAFEHCPLAGAAFSGAKLKDVELRGCDLEGVSGAAGLRGAAMPVVDALANVTVLAAAAGVRLLDE